MLIKIDVRETALLQLIIQQIANIPVFNNIKIKTETLPIGDIIITDDSSTNVDRIIIERKSVADLMASIKDGRYEEQSYRLNGLSHHNHNIIYLIEGDVNHPNRFKSGGQIEKLTLYSAMFSLNYYKGFSVFRSVSMEETANVICNMAYKIGKDLNKKAYYSNTTITSTNDTEEQPIQQQEDEKDYVGVIKKVKKDNITPDNIGEIMLCQIPGISSVTALAVMEKYKTIPNLIKELELNGDTMKDLSYTNAKGQVRRINKTSIANIAKFLLPKINDVENGDA